MILQIDTIKICIRLIPNDRQAMSVKFAYNAQSRKYNCEEMALTDIFPYYKDHFVFAIATLQKKYRTKVTFSHTED